MAERPILVKAVHAYSPVNNDEIKLDKGEILTVTRKEDGGWWEGTLSNGKTGWFPSNYVEDIGAFPSSSSTSPLSSLSPVDSPHLEVAPIVGGTGGGQNGSSPSGDPSAFAVQQAEYRQVAFKELIDSECAHVEELQAFWDSHIIPLQKSEMLNPGEFKALVGNYQIEVANIHLALINQLKIEQTKPLKDQRIGNIFLENAPKFEEVHKIYCSNHPKAVQVVEKHKEALSIFIESNGGVKPGILNLITSLSQPFRRLEKYPSLLQEIERHVEEFHKDRGDLQRSIEYYKEIQKNCSDLRKQKEMELEVLSGAIKDWEGSDVSQLGEIVFMNLVYLGNDRNMPRYLVLFANTLLILSYNTETNTLVYEGKVPVSGITVRTLVDKDSLSNAFEIAGPMIDQIIVSCSGKSVRETWLNHLNSILKTNRFPSFSSSPQQVHFSRSQPLLNDTFDKTFFISNEESLNLSNSTLLLPHSDSEYKYVPSSTPPYVLLVAYLQTLYKGGMIHSKSFEIMQRLEIEFDNIDLECYRRIKPPLSPNSMKYTPLSQATSLDFGRGRTRQRLLLPTTSIPTPSFEFTFSSDFDSDNSTIRDSSCSTTSSSSPSEYKLTKEPGYPFHKWRWGMSNLCMEKLHSSTFLSPISAMMYRNTGSKASGGGGAPIMQEKSPGDLHLDRSRSITFGDTKLYWKIKGTFSSFMSRSQSLPVIKLTFSDKNETHELEIKSTPEIPDTMPLIQSESPERFSHGRRLVRQNAFDYDDGELENLPDLNDNLQIVNNGASSFDSGLGDLTPSNRTTQTNFYEEITFEVSSPITEEEARRGSSAGNSSSSGDAQSSRADLYRSGLYAHWLLKFESSFK